jgi:X-X-X-Leu-X-X-Gly heptad repeat protein
MQTTAQTLRALFLACRPAHTAITLGLLILGFAQSGLAQQTTPLNFENNYFVTGDYVVAGVGLRGLGVNGFASRQFTMPDANSVPATGVPQGADIVAAFLYWETVEGSQTGFAGQNGFFRPVFAGGPASGYPITGVVLGNPNAPVSWSSGGCSGSSQGSKTMRTYAVDVSRFLPQDAQGNILANGTYEVRLADSGSNGGGTPLTLGASLIIIYRAITPSLPLTSVVIYDGAFAPANGSSTMSQTMQGFYQAAAGPISKLTHIVGNGQSNKFETVSLDGVNLPSRYGNLPPFPGFYNGSWDDPTWSFSGAGNPVQANDSSATTTVAPSSSNGGCVSWGVVVMSTTVQNSDNDGILDVWKQKQGYCDASVNEGMCTTTDPTWVSLPGATLGKKDLFVQLDHMCSIVNPDGTCDTTNGYSFDPPASALTMMTNAFSAKGTNLHLIPGNPAYPAALATGAIQEQTCTDTTDASGNPVLCEYPNQPGLIGWKAGFEFLKNQPLNYPDETSCEQALNGPCIRRFQHGRKDSYHYAMFAHAVGLPEWGLQGGSVTSIVASGNTVTFTTSGPHGLTAGTDRVTITDAITNPSLNGTYLVQTASGNTFTIQIPTAANATYTQSTDPWLSVATGRIRTTSGVSDIGGADSLVSLGLWKAAGRTDPVQAGTFMHELGHSLGLTHGGLYYDTAGSYSPTLEPNCKPNYQSVMSYQFQVDLLDNGVLDYSEQQLSTLNENGLPGGLIGTDGSAPAFSTTKWYSPVPPNGVGSPAKSHCDGSALSPNTDPDPTMYLVEGAADPIAPVSAWLSGSDVNFDGTLSPALRGYDDWANLDLRQIGATGSEIFGGGKLTVGTGKLTVGTGKLTVGTGKLTVGAGKLTVGTGVGDLTFETANSSVRSPRNLTATLTTPNIRLNWVAPSFGQIGSYNIYRSTNGASAVLISSVLGTSLSFTDTTVACGPTYSYFVTAVLANTNPPQESVPSNTTSAIPICKPTSTTVASPVNPSIFGQSVTFTATVTNTSGDTATPTGSVQFSVDGAPFGPAVPLSGSGTAVMAASGATAALTVSGSPHTVKAVYTNTDGNFSGSSGTLGQAVNPAPTSTTVASSVNPSIYGQSVTFTATVANTAGAAISTATPTGSVQFYVDGAASGAAVPVSGSGASVTAASATATLTVSGSLHTIKAVYTNTDGNFNGSSGTMSPGQTVNPAPTSTTVASSVNPSIYGQSVTFTATVANTAGAAISTATPTGSVQFFVDGAAFGAPVPLSGSGASVTAASGAIATLTVSGSPHTIKAVYTNTDRNFSGSSGTLGQTVNPAPTSTTVASSVNPSVYGQSVTFTATVANTAGAAISTATPTGSVQFMDGASLIGTPQNLSGLGTATLTTSALTAGNHPITAVYTNIDGNFRGSTSSSVTQVVQDFSITATPSAQTISSGHQAVYSITVTPISGLAGTIALSCSGAPPNSTCSVSPSTSNLQGTPVLSKVTLSANQNVNHGTFTLTFTGSFVGRTLTHSTTVQLTVK